MKKIDGLPTEEHPQIEDLASLFLNDIPMLDVRAPIEFEQGAFPNTINIPLMVDAEREAVGIEYKEQGQDAAIELGATLVTEDNRNLRKKAWATFFKNNPQGVLYCFRGGLRSKISQQWVVDETGIQYPRVKGGYKALRRFLIESIDRIASEIPIVILGGRTGSGKTRVLKKLDNSIDLEGLANHRGSAFGPTATPQPTQINFENALAIQLLKQEAAGCKFLVIEDEGRNVGSVGVPQSLYDKMQQAPIVKLEVPDSERNRISVQEYVLDIYQQFYDICHDKEEAFNLLSNHLNNSLDKIQKRLGGERFQEAQNQMRLALATFKNTQALEEFEPLVNTLLFDYYDPMYDYQIAKKEDRIVLSGSQQEIMTYLESYKPN
ncbi:MAG TPA: tRNA 2-selenouridine(34) synthase MnmH [Leucothrix mucor]|nr:tRNA 2-selenouridine(34) synthase MnmH [Leucothrix mucor]